ncbi:MAG: hypothetical protein Q7J31_13120 [Syntrophales bacterium]|nr:hypothetical protein [Syntrophales bacterium]
MIIFGVHFSSSDIWLLGICGTLVMALVGYRLLLNVQKHNTFITAAGTFRSTILSEIESIYPITRFWDEKLFPRFRQSIPKIDRAAAEFRYFVKPKTNFDAAINEYREYCRTITWDKCVQWDMYPSTRRPGDKGPIEKFKHLVENLLLHAKEK